MRNKNGKIVDLKYKSKEDSQSFTGELDNSSSRLKILADT